MVTRTTVVSVAEGKHAFAKTGDEVVLMSIDSGNYYSLNPVGARFWELIQQPVSIEAAVTAITDEFEASADLVEQDLIELTDQLVKAGLATASTPTA